MIYLRTGANGSCKTLFTLADVRKLQLETGRPVCVNARFKIYPEKLVEFGWQVIEFKDWQAQEDGTIFLIDECHNDLPIRPNGSAVPEPVKMLAEHRARGFDFFLLTQHPMNLDAFVRKLIGAPGWHQHLKRVFGGTGVTRVLQWDAVKTDCEKDGSGNSAQITNRTHPKEVYDWYDSAVIHTAKVRIPKMLWVLLGALVVVAGASFFGYRSIKNIANPDRVSELQSSSQNLAPPGRMRDTKKSEVKTRAEYLSQYVPRVTGLLHTAPVYDTLTTPVRAPRPAGCAVTEKKGCKCYTQDGTPYPTTPSICGQIVKDGIFLDYELSPNAPANNQAVAMAPPLENPSSGDN